MSPLRSLMNIAWRSLLVALGYFVGLTAAGMVSVLSGAQMPASAGSNVAMLWIFVSTFVLGLILCPLALRLALSRGQHFVLWFSLIFFNLGSVAIEGKFFAPALVPLPLSVLFLQQLAASAGAALIVTLTCADLRRSLNTGAWGAALRRRPWFAWLGRFALSAFSYLVFYFIFGALNYALVTRPYYDSHAGGLVAPAPEVVLAVELARAPLIVFSILLFLLSAGGTKRELMLKAGWLLFAVGGIVPLVLQISSLPVLLLAASAVEIFCQNFLTGAVSAWLLGVEAG